MRELRLEINLDIVKSDLTAEQVQAIIERAIRAHDSRYVVLQKTSILSAR